MSDDDSKKDDELAIIGMGCLQVLAILGALIGFGILILLNTCTDAL